MKLPMNEVKQLCEEYGVALEHAMYYVDISEDLEEFTGHIAQMATGSEEEG